ncbi:pyrroline-5-carboxylate reductase [Acuticoccus sediminis]|uniref:Pyrroline-5-carboxylate reductase n=1 Tax=Acuticoccus sediminis TaxID=2184697 RepID=A0A8B2NP88_9HYPH|nr:pyrroline-5-carboxylate reductase [Acuticoccus sediminis]RAH98899.1 pyrroline-5-carboxylate reductase [Acuticoccus sediminis]
MSPERPLLLVGAGNMGGAMLEGWLNAGTDPRSIVVVDPAADLDTPRRPGLRVYTSPPDVVAHTVVLAVKPQSMAEVLPTLQGNVDGDTIVISIAAGITVAKLKTLGRGPIVRSIPNTPAAIGQGMTCAVAIDATPHVIEIANELLGALGKVAWVDDEGLIDAATAVSGSGPAYVFHLVEAMTAAGEAAGLPSDVAAVLARQTVVGAGALLARSPLDPATLRRNVTSPGGTTAAALSVLADTGALTELMTRAVDSAARRSRELGS